MKEWECVAVGHHKDIGKVIGDWEKAGWNLHTYTAAQMRPGIEIFIICFLKEANKKPSKAKHYAPQGIRLLREIDDRANLKILD